MNDFDSLKVGNYCLLSVITFNVLTAVKISYAWYYSIFYKGGLINVLVQKGGLIGEGGLKREFMAYVYIYYICYIASIHNPNPYYFVALLINTHAVLY